MAGPTVKEILLKWGIDNSNWKSAINDLAKLLDQQSAKSAKTQADSLKALEAQKAKVTDLISARKSETAELQKQIDAEKLKATAASATKSIAQASLAQQKQATSAQLAAAKQQAAATAAQLAQQRLLAATQKTIQANVNAQYLAQKLVTAQLQSQTAALRQQALVARQHQAQQKKTQSFGGGGGGKGGKGGFLGGLTGTGLAATFSAAVAAGELLANVIEKIAAKLDTMVKSIGPLQQLEEQFNKLSKSAGINPAQFINDLRTATKGLVDDTTLYRNANLFMQSGVHATEADVVKLTKATVGLARAQGRDATAAIQSLNRYFVTGRAMVLGHATGLQKEQFVVKGLGKDTDATTKSTLEFRQALNILTAQYAAVGEPAQTYTEVLSKLGNSVERVFQQFTLGMVKSAGFTDFVQMLSTLADNINEFAGKMQDFGAKFSSVFSAAIIIAQELGDFVKDVLVAAFVVLKEVATDVGATFAAMVSVFSEGAGSELKERFSSITGAVTSLAEALTIAIAGARELVNMLLLVAKVGAASAGPLGAFGGSRTKGALDTFSAQEKEIEAATNASIDKLEKVRTGGQEKTYKLNFAFPSAVESETAEAAAAQKIAKVKEEIAIQSSKIQLDQTQQRIAKEEELVQLQYDQGLSSLKTFLAQKAELDKQDHEAKMLQLKQEYQAKSAATEAEIGESRKLAEEKIATANVDAKIRQMQLTSLMMDTTKQLADDKNLSPGQKEDTGNKLLIQQQVISKLIEASRKASVDSANASLAEMNAKGVLDSQQYLANQEKEKEEYAKKGRAATEQDVKDEVEARQKLADTLTTIEKDRVSRAKELTEDEFKEGEITAQQYLEARVGYIEQEYEATVAGIQKKLAANKDSETAQAEAAQKTAEASANREKELTAISLQETGIRTKAAEDAYDKAESLLSSQLKFSQATSVGDPFGGSGDQAQILETMIALQQQKMEQEIKDLSLLKEGSNEWYTQQERIMGTREALVQYNAELIKTQDYMSVVAGQVQGFASAIDRLPKGAKTGSALDKFAGELEQSSKLRQGIQQRTAAQAAKRQGAAAVPVTPQQIFAALNKVSNETGQNLGVVSKHLTEASEDVQKWQGTLETLRSSLQTSIDTTTASLASQLVPAANAAATALNNIAAGKPPASTGTTGGEAYVPDVYGTKSSGNSAFSMLSGQASAGSPLGTATASDTQHMTASMASLPLGSGMSQEAQQLSAALALASQQSVTFAKNLNSGNSTFSTFLGDNGLMGGLSKIFGSKDSETGGGGSDSEVSTDMQNFSDSLKGFIGDIGGIMTAATGKGGALNAAMAGGQSGFQIGSMIGGPIGGIIGGAGGAALGAFTGKARDEAEKLAKQIEAKFQAAMDNLASGSQTLGATVQAEIQQIQDAVSQLSGKKGGRDQLKSILPGMEQQLAQLQDQQHQVIQSFDQQLDVLNTPTAYQQQVTNIQQIIDKYQQYIQAGGSVVNANTFLQQSFNQLATQGYAELNQDEQDAINNALNYNDLLIQRQSLIEDTNSQIQNIMSQGVAVQQLPEGVSKAQQIQSLMLNANSQMDQMNEEIAVSQHKLQNEQTIYNLATTRIGLETQLVALQDQQADIQDQGVVALQKTLGMLQTQGDPTSMLSALSGLGLGGAYVSPGSEPNLMPVAPTPTGVASIDQQNQLEYQQQMAAYNQSLNPPGGFIPSTGSVLTSPIPGAIGSGSAFGPGLTTNNEQVDTVSTASGNALLVTMGTGGASETPSSAIPGGMGLATSTISGLGTLLAPPAAPSSGAPSTLSGLPASIQLPLAAGGASVNSTGAVVVHAGETIVPAGVSDLATSAMSGVSSDLANWTAKQTIETNISQLSASRVASEAALVQLKMGEINADMQRVQAHNDLLDRIQTGSSAGSNIEDSLSSLYNKRGRQGFGGFYGETANAI
jgi:hypothetical protein